MEQFPIFRHGVIILDCSHTRSKRSRKREKRRKPNSIRRPNRSRRPKEKEQVVRHDAIYGSHEKLQRTATRTQTWVYRHECISQILHFPRKACRVRGQIEKQRGPSEAQGHFLKTKPSQTHFCRWKGSAERLAILSTMSIAEQKRRRYI